MSSRLQVCLYWVQSSKDVWVAEATAEYSKKISRFCDFTLDSIRASRKSRSQFEQKTREEEISILKKIKSTDYVVVFDESASPVKDSRAFSKKITTALEGPHKRVVFIVGGAFGLGAQIKARADLAISLSTLTFSHQVALIVVLEQVYRSFSIWKGLPYHND